MAILQKPLFCSLDGLPLVNDQVAKLDHYDIYTGVLTRRTRVNITRCTEQGHDQYTDNGDGTWTKTQ